MGKIHFHFQKLPIQTVHHTFLESRHPEVTKYPYYVLSSKGSQKKVLAHGLFIKDFFISVRHHLEKVVEISLCGCTKFSNNCFVPVFLKDAVILIYCLKWAITQSSMSLNIFSSIDGK